MIVRLLSTPHGALGTRLLNKLKQVKGKLSTPHGALGTEKTPVYTP